ncbi:MAG: hypothetical protein ABIT37_14400 [Luteolibacter sp.]
MQAIKIIDVVANVSDVVPMKPVCPEPFRESRQLVVAPVNAFNSELPGTHLDDGIFLLGEDQYRQSVFPGDLDPHSVPSVTNDGFAPILGNRHLTIRVHAVEISHKSLDRPVRNDPARSSEPVVCLQEILHIIDVKGDAPGFHSHHAPDEPIRLFQKFSGSESISRSGFPILRLTVLAALADSQMIVIDARHSASIPAVSPEKPVGGNGQKSGFRLPLQQRVENIRDVLRCRER